MISPLFCNDKMAHRDEVCEELVEWLQKNRFDLNDNISFLKYPDYRGNAVFASSYIKKGEVLFQIPEDMILSPSNSEISDLLQE